MLCIRTSKLHRSISHEYLTHSKPRELTVGETDPWSGLAISGGGCGGFGGGGGGGGGQDDTPMHRAAVSRHSKSVRVLLQLKGDVSATNVRSNSNQFLLV
jgi:hypothetical protein